MLMDPRKRDAIIKRQARKDYVVKLDETRGNT